MLYILDNSVKMSLQNVFCFRKSQSVWCHWVVLGNGENQLNLCSGHLLDQSRSFGQVEFTQPLGVGLGLAVRINNQYSHPVCTGRHTDDYMTINDMQEISR